MKKSHKKSKKKRILKRRVAIVLFIALFIIILIKNLICSARFKSIPEETRVLLNNEYISLKDDVKIEDKNIYISEDDIKNIFDESIYYNVGDKELITTYNNHVAVLHLDENQMTVNDSTIDIEAPLKEIDSKIYLPLGEMNLVYDIETKYSEDTNTLIVDSTDKSKYKALVLRNTRLKASRMPFSCTVEKVNQGNTVYIIEDKGRYKKVRTEKGIIGYIKSRKISDPEAIRENYEEESKEINILDDYSDYTQTYGTPDIDKSKDNVAIIDSFKSNKKGEISNSIDATSDVYQSYYNWAEENEIDIVGNYQNSLTVSNSMATYTQRNEIINTLYANIMQNLQRGICLEFSEIDDINSFYRLLIEMRPKFKESGLKVIVKLNDQMDKKKVKSLVDYCY